MKGWISAFVFSFAVSTCTFFSATLAGPPTSDANSRSVKSNTATAALKNLRKSLDKVEGVSWYNDKHLNSLQPEEAFQRFGNDLRISGNELSDEGRAAALLKYSSPLYIYLGQKDGNKWLRMVITYAGISWAFVQSYKIVVDGKPFEISADATQIKREAKDGAVYETLDIKVPETYLPLIQSVVKSKETIIRFYGQQKTADHTVTKMEKAGIRNILALFDAKDF